MNQNVVNYFTGKWQNKDIKKLLYNGYGHDLNGTKTRYKEIEHRKTYDQVKNAVSYFGVLAPGVVLVDVDDMGQAKKLLDVIQNKGINCPVLQTTKGMHFYFKDSKGIYKNARTHHYTACGVIVDIKTSVTNGIAYLKKPKEEKEREFIHGLDLEDIPPILYPFKQAKKNEGETTALFNDFVEGARNSTLTAHILALLNVGLDKEIIKKIITDINDYFFITPLDNEELKLILRDETFIKGEQENKNKIKKLDFFSDSGKFYHAIFGDYIIEKYNIVRHDEELYYFNDIKNQYLHLYHAEELERLFTKEIKELKINQRKEVRGYIKLKAPNKKAPNYNLIAFENGVYNLETKEIIEINKNYLFFNVIPWRYSQEIEHDGFIDNYLDSLTCGDNNLKKVLLEFIGFCFYRNNSLRKSILITGGKYNGKSKFYSLLETLLGEDNCYMGMSLDRLNARFDIANLRNKLLTACDDIDGGYIKDTSILKKVISGDSITAEEKGKPAKPFKYYGKLTLSANEVPRFNDSTGALASRITMVPFKNKFEPGTSACDPLIEEKFNNPDNMEYLIKISLEALHEVLEKKEFTTTEETKEALNDFRRENNPVIEFIEAQKEEHGEDFYLNIPCSEIYDRYESYCIFNKIPYMRVNSFGTRFKGELELKSMPKKINGEVKKYYVKR